MAIARLHGGPLDGQLLPLENPDLDRLIVPYSETQVVYVRKGGPRAHRRRTTARPRPSSGSSRPHDDIDPYGDSPRDRR